MKNSYFEALIGENFSVAALNHLNSSHVLWWYRALLLDNFFVTPEIHWYDN